MKTKLRRATRKPSRPSCDFWPPFTTATAHCLPNRKKRQPPQRPFRGKTVFDSNSIFKRCSCSSCSPVALRVFAEFNIGASSRNATRWPGWQGSRPLSPTVFAAFLGIWIFPTGGQKPTDADLADVALLNRLSMLDLNGRSDYRRLGKTPGGTYETVLHYAHRHGRHRRRREAAARGVAQHRHFLRSRRREEVHQAGQSTVRCWPVGLPSRRIDLGCRRVPCSAAAHYSVLLLGTSSTVVVGCFWSIGPRKARTTHAACTARCERWQARIDLDRQRYHPILPGAFAQRPAAELERCDLDVSEGDGPVVALKH